MQDQPARVAKDGLSLRGRICGHPPRRAHFGANVPHRAHPSGRSSLAVGLVGEARREAEGAVAALGRYLDGGMPVIGLEPSCLLGFRDEIPSLVKSEGARLLAANAVLFEEFLARETQAG